METPEQRVVAGRYRLRRLLGQGSMGTVWEAYDEFLQRPVAVKEVRVIPGIPEADADELRERTLREARAIAVVSHPNVVTLHDVARENGEPFVVMEYLPALNLAEVLRGFGPLDAPKAATVGDAIAAGLAAAHRAGITHRDVKPGNVLVTGDGQVKLTDFGIARNVAELTLTRTGMTLGSPAYMAPEVAAGGDVTPAADLWGLGATLFAAVEGRAPYDPDGAVLETLSAVVHGDVPEPSDGPLREVIAALMVKDPAGRASLDEVRRMLHPLLPPPGTPLYTATDDEEPAEAPAKAPAVKVPEPRPEAAPAEAAEPAPAPALAADPGPLPFAVPDRPAGPPRPVRPRGRGTLGWTAIIVSAALVFLIMGAGGFALARTVGGKPVLPPVRVTPTQPSAAPVDELPSQVAEAHTATGEQGARFEVPAPKGWTQFVQQRVSEDLVNSARVHFVAPDGTQQVTVERFPNLYPDHTIDTYVAVLTKQARLPEMPKLAAVTDPVPPGPEPAADLTYKTTEWTPGGDTGSYRVTFARLFPIGVDVWVVAVTVPIDQEDTGRTKLFDEVAKGFKVTG
ncbi:MAG TPA: serine/threonine-protein kinase [Actinophytocola sp.]|uniref:serine/threonine-protein kinase n=1 Tax=Actinophytocola sp. TaxID=1872138 RepID=UPI002DBD4E0A|nr:serine/threonine-protein kinase [Actinophytocola sp.]HEU5470402.1 serine/threonine-protein kinase [Actinophytocola sp.]